MIVGGGPAGSLSAIKLRNYDVLLVEEHQSPGFPVQCAGLVSEDCYRVLKRYSKCRIKYVRGAYLFSPSGKNLEIEGRSRGVLIDRKILDRDLLIKASEIADVWIKTKFVGVKDEHVAVLLRHGERVYREFEYLIGADGVYSRVARSFGFERPNVLSALQMECRFKPLSDDMVEIYFGKRFSNGFFAYSIPVDDFARVGVITRENPYFYLKNTIKFLSDRVSSSFVELNSGAIPIGLVDFVKENVILIGDSAGMTKPYTGGGLFYIIKAVEKLKFFPDLKRIRREYLRDLGREYRIGMKIFKLYSILDDRDYDYLIEVAREILHLIRDLHMDRPSTLIPLIPRLIKLIKRPGILKKMISLVF